jgi:hypothetical protein
VVLHPPLGLDCRNPSWQRAVPREAIPTEKQVGWTVPPLRFDKVVTVVPSKIGLPVALSTLRINPFVFEKPPVLLVPPVKPVTGWTVPPLRFNAVVPIVPSVPVIVKPSVSLWQKLGQKSRIVDVSSNNRIFRTTSPGSLGKSILGSDRAIPLSILPRRVIENSKMFDSEFDYAPKHPLTGESARGLRGNEEKINWTQHLSRKQYLLQGEADTQAFIFNAVCANSKSTYLSAQKPYIRYCSFMGTNPILSIIPQEWWETEPHPHSFKITMLSSYLSYLVNDNEGKPVGVSSAGNYLSAARKLMEDSGQCVAFMKDNPVLRATKRGMENEWVAVKGHSKAETALYCLSIDMIEHGKNELLHVDSDLVDLGIYTEQVISYGHINRSSEIILCPKTKHHLKTENVHFYLMPKEGEVFTGENYPDMPLEVEADKMDSYPDERVCGHNLFLINSKTDRFGSGHPNPGIRQLVLPPGAVYNMTNVLLHWYRMAHPLRGEPFLSSKKHGHDIVIVRSHLNSFHNRVAELFGLDPERVNTHSVRYAGACALKAAGFSDATIMFMGRWSTLCFLRYIRESIKSRYAIAAALANRDNFTIKDARLLSSSSAFRL